MEASSANRCFFSTGLALVLLSGCMSARFSTTLPPAPEETPAMGSLKFSLAAATGSVNLDSLRQAAGEVYPSIFGDDMTAVPVVVDVREEHTSYQALAILFGILTVGVIPYPMTEEGNFTVTLAAVDAEGERTCRNQVTFTREDATWVTVFSPFALIPVPGRSDIPREVQAGMDGNMDYLNRAQRLTVDSVVASVVQGLKGSDPAQLAAIAKSRDERQQEIVIDGAKYWSFLAPGFSQGIERQPRADLYQMLICRDRPSRTVQPLETVTVARRQADGRWQPVPGYVRTAKTLIAACALLEGGTPARLVMNEVPEPPLEDFIDLPAETSSAEQRVAAIRWSNRVLIQVKNRTLPKLLREKTPDECIDLATRIENVILDLNHQAELAKDQAQRLVEKGEDPAFHREEALMYRERIEVFKPIVMALKQAVAAGPR